MLKSEPVTLDGIEFTTTQFPAMMGFEMLGRLVKVLGPALDVLTGADPETEIEDLAPVLAATLKDMKPSDLSALVIDLLRSTTAKISDPTGGRLIDLGSKDAINLVFSGRLMIMFKVLVHAIKVNYWDFFAGSVPSAPPAPKPAAP